MKLICPTQNRLREFLEGATVDAESDSISAHINECSTCEQALSDLESQQDDVLRKLYRGTQTEEFLLEPEFAELRNTVGVGTTDTEPSTADQDQFGSGKRLRDYRLVKKIGEGGMGTVYQAVHMHLAKPVALKILPEDRLRSKQSVRRFRQEMRAVGRVSHPNVVSASDAGTVDGQHFLVMELVQGADLARIIHDQGRLTVADACEIVRQAASGLQHAHDNGLVHRDVKPSNVMLAVDGSVKLLDLGLASLNKTDFESNASVVVTDGLTSVGQIMGTLDYMAPEQITGTPAIDGRSDVYALGATLFQLLTSQTPCGDRSQGTPERIEAVLNDSPVDIASLRNDVPRELQVLLLRMLAKNPKDRPQSADEVADEIARFATGANLVALADACRTSLDMPSADVDVTDDASFLVSRTVSPQIVETKRKPLTARAFAGAFLALCAAAVYFIVTNNGTVKIEVLDKSFQTRIDGEVVIVEEDGKSEPITLRVGDHQLVVKVGATELLTKNFEVARQGKTAFRVELLKGEVVVSRDGKHVASRPMPETLKLPLAGPGEKGNGQMAEELIPEKAKTLADLPATDLAIIYRQLTGVELGEQIASDSPSADLARSVNVLLDYASVSREKIAKSLVDLGRPELAKIVLSEGRVAPSATEALKLGDFLVASGDSEKAVDAYLEAFRIAPRLFNGDEHISTFDKHNRLKDLAELFTEERISKTHGAIPQIDLLNRLMKDDTRATIGMPFMTRQWNARPDVRGFVSGDIPWNEVPNRLDYFRPLFIPSDITTVGNGWYELFAAPDVFGGWLVWLSKELDEESTRQLIAEIKPKVQQHDNWIAGEALLAALETKVGRYERAKRWLEENYESVVTPAKGCDRDSFLATYAEFLGSQLEGKDRELDLLVIKLYEQAVEHRCVRLPYRATKVHALAKLYHKYGRTKDARDLLYGLVAREREVDEYLIENFSNARAVNLDHERIWDLRTAVKTLNSIDCPLDSLTLLSRIDFEQRRRAGEYKGGGWTYDDKDVDRYTSRSQGLVTSAAIVEALNRGVLPVGLASTINKKSGQIDNPIIDLLEQIAHKELSDELKGAFGHVNPKLADIEAMDRHLIELVKQRPDDMDVAVAASIFAFLRDDIDTARKRLTDLVSIAEATPAFRAADVNLYLAAKYALEHEETAALGRRLATRGKEASEQMTDEWKQFFPEQTITKSAAGDSSKVSSVVGWRSKFN